MEKVGLPSSDRVLWKPNNFEGRMPKIRHRAWSRGDGRGHLSYVIASLRAKCWLVKWARPLAGMEERELRRRFTSDLGSGSNFAEKPFSDLTLHVQSNMKGLFKLR